MPLETFTPKSAASWKGKIACQYVYCNIRLDTTQVKTSVNSYIYALFEQGTSRILFDKMEVDTKPGDFIIFPPHIPPKMLKISPDYKAICLIVNSNFIYDNPLSQPIFQATAFPLLSRSYPFIKLSETERSDIREILHLIMRHISNSNPYTNEALQSLYSLLLSDLVPIMESNIPPTYSNKRNFNIFMKFITLVREHFRERHDTGFYADQLGISPRYLSMLTKQISSHTVSTIINHHLLLEACWLLKMTDYSIQQISEVLHFSDQASFSKFFKRLKGSNPLQYRREQEPYT